MRTKSSGRSSIRAIHLALVDVDAGDRDARAQFVTGRHCRDADSVGGRRSRQLHAGFGWLGHAAADDVRPRRGSRTLRFTDQTWTLSTTAVERHHRDRAVHLLRLSRLLPGDRAPRRVRHAQRRHHDHEPGERWTRHLLHVPVGRVQLHRQPSVRRGRRRHVRVHDGRLQLRLRPALLRHAVARRCRPRTPTRPRWPATPRGRPQPR